MAFCLVGKGGGLGYGVSGGDIAGWGGGEVS